MLYEGGFYFAQFSFALHSLCLHELYSSFVLVNPSIVLHPNKYNFNLTNSLIIHFRSVYERRNFAAAK